MLARTGAVEERATNNADEAHVKDSFSVCIPAGHISQLMLLVRVLGDSVIGRLHLPSQLMLMMRMSCWGDAWPSPGRLRHAFRLMLLMLMMRVSCCLYIPTDAHDARVLAHASQSRWLDDWLSATNVPADARDARVYGMHPS